MQQNNDYLYLSDIMEKERYIVKYNPDFVNVFGVSPVEDPANGYHFMCFSKDEKLKTATTNLATDGKRIVTGVILVPDQKIDRLNSVTKKLYTIEFPKEVVEKFSRDFFIGGFNTNAWENHNRTKPINGFTYFENWTVTDEKNDKANALGFNVPAGTWMMSAYVEDDKVWQQCLDGTFRGFSIDSIIDFVKIDESQQNLHNNITNKKEEKMGLLKKIISIFSEEVKLATQTVEGIGELTADSFEIGQLVVGPDMQPLKSAEWESEGVKFKTDENGLIIEAEKTEDEQPMVDNQEPAMAPEQSTEMAEYVFDQMALPEGLALGDVLKVDNGNGPELYANADFEMDGKHVMTDENGVVVVYEDVQVADVQETPEMVEMKKKLEMLEAQVELLQRTNLELTGKIDVMSKAPAADKAKANNKTILSKEDIDKMTPLERYRYFKNN